MASEHTHLTIFRRSFSRTSLHLSASLTSMNFDLLRRFCTNGLKGHIIETSFLRLWTQVSLMRHHIRRVHLRYGFENNVTSAPEQAPKQQPFKDRFLCESVLLIAQHIPNAKIKLSVHEIPYDYFSKALQLGQRHKHDHFFPNVTELCFYYRDIVDHVRDGVRRTGQTSVRPKLCACLPFGYPHVGIFNNGKLLKTLLNKRKYPPLQQLVVQIPILVRNDYVDDDGRSLVSLGGNLVSDDIPSRGIATISLADDLERPQSARYMKSMTVPEFAAPRFENPLEHSIWKTGMARSMRTLKLHNCSFRQETLKTILTQLGLEQHSRITHLSLVNLKWSPILPDDCCHDHGYYISERYCQQKYGIHCLYERFGQVCARLKILDLVLLRICHRLLHALQSSPTQCARGPVRRRLVTTKSFCGVMENSRKKRLWDEAAWEYVVKMAQNMASADQSSESAWYVGCESIGDFYRWQGKVREAENVTAVLQDITEGSYLPAQH